MRSVEVPVRDRAVEIEREMARNVFDAGVMVALVLASAGLPLPVGEESIEVWQKAARELAATLTPECGALIGEQP